METVEIDDLLEDIHSGNAARRQAAIDRAPSVGTAAIPALAEVMRGSDMPAFRTAQECLRAIGYWAGRSKAAAPVASELVKLIGKDQPYNLRADALMLLGFVASDADVALIAAQLDDAEVRESARMALERIPGRAAGKALSAAAESVPDDYRPAIQQSLMHKRTKTGPARSVR